ncbi:hypothetical protein AB8O64_22285 [Streptomyces sp. QH1-20]|uniref:DUF7683 domain-containing protein n=1 Tax=Streptomyces sp. QH1-20 TaxID=3240934 RepID=UPI0035158BD9
MKFTVISYPKGSDHPDGETDVSEVGVEALANLLGIPADSLIDVYPLGEVQLVALHRISRISFDLSSHEYFLEPQGSEGEDAKQSFGWPTVAMAVGTRVTVVRDSSWDGPWQVEFQGTIGDLYAPEPVRHSMARDGELEYWVVFDEPQYDSSGEGPYRGAQIWDRYLIPEV